MPCTFFVWLFSYYFEQGALFGGLISLCFVVYIGIMALFQNGEVEPLPLSLATCDCFVSNATLSHSMPANHPQ